MRQDGKAAFTRLAESCGVDPDKVEKLHEQMENNSQVQEKVEVHTDLVVKNDGLIKVAKAELSEADLSFRDKKKDLLDFRKVVAEKLAAQESTLNVNSEISSNTHIEGLESIVEANDAGMFLDFEEFADAEAMLLESGFDSLPDGFDDLNFEEETLTVSSSNDERQQSSPRLS